MKLSVVIPMYNEAKVIADSAKELSATLERDFGSGEYEVLFVSDGSSDGCDRIVADLEKELPGIHLISYTPNHGKGYAVRTGVLASKGDFVLFTDSDLAYGSDVIKTFYDTYVKTSSHAVIASRAIKGGGYDGYSFKRKIMSKIYLKVISVAAGFHHTDSQAGLKGFDGKTGRKIFSLCTVDRFAFDLEVLMIADRLGCSFSEVPVKVIRHGESKVNPVRDALNMLGQIRKIKKHVRTIPKQNTPADC